MLNRRSSLRSLFAACAILLSPGILGPWLAAAHICPTTVADAPMAGMDMGGQHDSSGGHQHKTESCHCVGSCCIVAMPASTAPAIDLAPAMVLSATGFRSLASFHLVLQPYQLPPALAPPLSI